MPNSNGPFLLTLGLHDSLGNSRRHDDWHSHHQGLGMVGIDAIIDVINVMSRGQGRKDVSARWSLAPSIDR